MIISIPVDINLLLTLLKNFPWPIPDSCPRCGNSRVWGHGFVDCFFDGIKYPLPLKRFRCPNCSCVIKLRPDGYFQRFQASITAIRDNIHSRLNRKETREGISRQRRDHWFNALKRKAVALLGLGSDPKQAFENLMSKGIIPVSRSFLSGNQAACGPPHRRVASTGL